MNYLSIIKKQGITTALKAVGHLTFLKTSGLFRTYLTFAHKNNKALLHKGSLGSYSSQNKRRASSDLV